MATQWSSWDYAGGNGMRVGIDVSVSSVSHSTSTVTITWRVYTGNQYNYQDSGQRLEYSGDKSGSQDYNNTQGSGSTTLRDTFTTTHTYSSYGSSPGKHTVTVQVAGTYNGSDPSKTVSVTIPARPYASPNPPSSVSVSRTSDTRAVVSWSRNNTAGRPYTRLRVQRQRNGSGWSSGSTVSGTSSSYVSDTGANAYYLYRVRAENSVGVSAWVESGFYRTSPAAPTSVTAGRSGSDIRVTWNASVTYSTYTGTVQRQLNGGTWSTVASGLSSSTTAWRDTSTVSGSEHRYRVRNVETTQVLVSDWVMSGTVSTEVAPNPPTQLVPDGSTIDGTMPATLRWQHNPGTDGADQTEFRIERAVAGDAATWTYVATVASDLSEWVAPAGTFANGTTWRWRVQTKGSHVDWSPNSPTATLYAWSTPTVTVSAPTGTLLELPVVVEWAYGQAESRAQNRATVHLYDSTSSSILQTWTVLDAATTVELTGYPFEDGVAYSVTVIVESVDGQSAAASTSFDLDLLPPALVTLEPEFDGDTGTVAIDVSAAAPVPGVTSEVATVSLQRRIGTGDWVTLYADVVVDGGITVLDTTPSLKAVHEYRAIVWSVAPSAAVTEPVALITEGSLSTPWAFLSYGDGFGMVLRGRGNPQLAESRDRTRALVPVGRRDPLLLIGHTRSRSRSVALTLMWHEGPGFVGPSSTDVEFLDAADEADIACWRDWTGARIFGRLSSVDVDQRDDYRADVGFSVEQSDWDESVKPVEVPDIEEE